VVQVVAVVDDIDAADEGHLAVDHAQLLVQPPQLARLQPRVPAVERAKDLELHAAAGSHSRSGSIVDSVPKPSTTSRTATPRRAAATSASATARPASSSLKM
jgi:hypothetical protein